MCYQAGSMHTSAAHTGCQFTVHQSTPGKDCSQVCLLVHKSPSSRPASSASRPPSSPWPGTLVPACDPVAGAAPWPDSSASAPGTATWSAEPCSCCPAETPRGHVLSSRGSPKLCSARPMEHKGSLACHWAEHHVRAPKRWSLGCGRALQSAKEHTLDCREEYRLKLPKVKVNALRSNGPSLHSSQGCIRRGIGTRTRS